jgi:PAS domain S-box-containing protein
MKPFVQEQSVTDVALVFNSMPGDGVLVLPDAPVFTIAAATERYLQATGCNRSALAGMGFFEAFPAAPAEAALLASLAHVLKHKEPHSVDLQQASDTETHSEFVYPYRRASHQPVLDAEGRVVYIIHTAEAAHGTAPQPEGATGERINAEHVYAAASPDISVVKEAEQTKEKYRSLFESVDQGFCILEMLFDESNRPFDYRFLETNPIFEKQTGLKQAVGKTARELVPDLEPHWFEKYGNVALTGNAIRFTQGSAAMGRWFDVYAFRLGEAASRQVALLFTDITERKLAEESVKQSEENFRNMIEQAPVAICIMTGPASVLEAANPLMLELMGKQSGAVLHKPILDSLPELREQGFEALLQQVYATGQRFAAHERPVRLMRNGTLETVYVNFVYEPLRESNGTIKGIIAVAVEVTEQVLEKKRIQERTDELQIAIAVANLGTFRVDLATNRATYSQRVIEWFGFTEPEMSMDVIFTYIHPDDRQRVIQALKHSFHSVENSRHDITYRVVHPVQGVLRHLRSFGKTYFKEDGAPYLVIGMIQDVTAQVRYQQQLEDSEAELQKRVLERTLELENLNNELRRTNTNLEEFAYAASHDMKEPIRKIHFFSERLKQELSAKLDQNQAHLFGRMELAARRMGTLIDDLLTYSQISRGAAQFEAIDLNRKVEAVLEDLELEIGQKQAVITKDPLPVIHGHRRQVQQLFQNLIGNALKYSKPGVPPQVHISARVVRGSETPHTSPEASETRYHLLEVRDNGIGFEQEDAERIFNVFTRLHGNSEYRGTGVGLSIVRKVVENHNGFIWAEGSPGEGAVFKLALPAELP